MVLSLGRGGGSLTMVKNPLIIFLVQICIVISAKCNFFFFFLTTDHSALFDYFLIHTLSTWWNVFAPKHTCQLLRFIQISLPCCHSCSGCYFNLKREQLFCMQVIMVVTKYLRTFELSLHHYIRTTSVPKINCVFPRHNRERYGRRSFSCTGPVLWNSLPEDMRLADCFKSQACI